jgi:cytochrome P450
MAVALVPPGPRGTWLGGNLAQFGADRLGFLERCARDFGDVVAIRLGPRRIYLVHHPDLIEEVLVHRNHDFIKHFALRMNPLVLGNGLLTSEGDFWLRQRRLIQPAFQKSRIAAYGPAMVECATRVVNSWRPGAERDILREMMRLTLMIAAQTLFGADVDRDATDVGVALETLLEAFLTKMNRLIPIPHWVPTPMNLRFKRALRRLDGILYDFIRQRRAGGGERSDLLSILLHARDEEGGRMTDKQLRDEAMTLFLAGHETTALTLSWTWYLLATHPEAQERLAAEVRSVIGDRLPTADDVPRLIYTERVVLESMRVFPAVYLVGREATRDMELGGFHVPRGMTIMMSQWIVHRDARFFDRPTEFRPERWEGDFARTLPHFAYFPFGGGPRLCIGNTFALLEAALCLAVLAQRCRFTLSPDQTVVPWPSFTLRPKNGIRAVITPR